MNSEISSLVLPLLLAPKTANWLRSYSWACRAPSVATASGMPSRRTSQIRFLAGKIRLEPSPVRNSLPVSRIAWAASRAALEIELPDDAGCFEHLANQGKLGVLLVVRIHWPCSREVIGKSSVLAQNSRV